MTFYFITTFIFILLCCINGLFVLPKSSVLAFIILVVLILGYGISLRL